MVPPFASPHFAAHESWEREPREQLAFTRIKGAESVDKLQAKHNDHKALGEALERPCKGTLVRTR